MNSETDYLMGQDGLRLFYRAWIPESTEKVLCIIHGHGEHSGRYEYVAQALTDKNMAVFAMDLRGHGLSKGKRGHSSSYEVLLDDVAELLKTAREQYNEQPMYLMGHSMGGNLVANFMIQDQSKEIKGFILSSPWFRLAFQPPALKLKLARIMAKIWPAFSEPNNLNTAHLSRIPEEVSKYEADELVHGMISAGLFTAITQGGELALKNAHKISKPGLVYHGNEDRIIDFQTTESFAKNNPNKLEWMPLPGVYHEPHNDLGREKIIEKLVDWISRNG